MQGLIAAGLALTYTKLTGQSNLLTMTAAELDYRFGEDSNQTSENAQNRVMLVMPFGPFLCLAALKS